MKIIATDRAPAAIGPYSQATIHGTLCFCSGQIAIDPATGDVVGGAVAEQTRQVFRNLSAVLEAAGSSLNQTLKTTVYLASMDDFPRMNEVYAQVLGGHRPARATVEVSRLPKSVLVEIDAVAAVSTP